MGKAVSRCVILSAGPCEGIDSLRALLRTDDVFIAADGGCRLAQMLGVTPQIVVADFDSSDPLVLSEDTEIVRLPVRKDCTDTAAAVEVALDKGYCEFLLLGVLGGRLDHEFAVYQLLVRLAERGCTAVAADAHNLVYALTKTSAVMEPMDGWMLSVFAFGGTVRGLSIRGAAYELIDYTLSTNDSLCVSNATKGVPCEISFTDGTLLVFRSKD
ncbi:MAG: thiamine diphosphokinase [Clostridia bacterium]|nr:thiamine diphosphokinase [Clostridia bacterium]